MKIRHEDLAELTRLISGTIGSEYVFAIVLASKNQLLVSGDTDNPHELLELGATQAGYATAIQVAPAMRH